MYRIQSIELCDYCWIDPSGNARPLKYSMHFKDAEAILKELNVPQIDHPVQQLLKLKWIRVSSFGKELDVQVFHPSHFNEKVKNTLIEIAQNTGKNIINLEVWGGGKLRTVWEKDNIMDN